MKIRAVKAIGDDAELLGTRLVAASAALSQLTAEPQDAFKKLDLDIEYEDGGRVKMEGRA